MVQTHTVVKGYLLTSATLCTVYGFTSKNPMKPAGQNISVNPPLDRSG